MSDFKPINFEIMKRELEAAADFLVSTVKAAKACSLNDESLSKLRIQFMMKASDHYLHHWHPEQPVKGSGYRCIRNNGKLDPLLAKVSQAVNLQPEYLLGILPRELTLWIDPQEVSYRFGENGSISILYEDRKANTSPSPPSTPLAKKIKSEIPVTPVKLTNTQHQLLHTQQITPPHIFQHSSPPPPPSNYSSTRRFNHSIFHQPFNTTFQNCKDLTSSVFPAFAEGLYVSS